MGQHGLRIDIDGMASGGLHDRYALGSNMIAEILDRGDAVLEIIFMEDFFQPNGDGLQIPAGQAAVGRETPRSGSTGFAPVRRACRHSCRGIPRCSPDRLSWPTWCTRPHRKTSPGDLFHRLLRIPLLPQFDEIGVLSEPAGVQIERNVIRGEDLLDLADIGHGGWLSPSGVIGHRDHGQGNLSGPTRSISSRSARVSTLPLNG